MFIPQICKYSRNLGHFTDQRVRSPTDAHVFILYLFPVHDLVPELFGTFNRTTATLSEVQLSSTFQAIVASFAKNPFVSPAPTWPTYNPDAATLANLAFHGNVAPDNVVEATSPAQLDRACTLFWDKILAP
jgi:hypothetical protein